MRKLKLDHLTGMAVLVLGLLFAAAGAEGQREEPLSLWRTSGAWNIFVDASVGNGCLIQQYSEEGLDIRLGYLPERLGAFFSVASQEWHDIDEIKSRDISLFFDDVAFEGTTEFFENEGFFGGFAFFNNPDFMTDFAKRKSMKVVGPEGDKVVLNLAGTALAIRALDECQKSH
ncbi:MAG: hypothetical protein JXR15_13195 [Shimia sp.]|uniref:hypothetical protein n=1 Tax=Shimia sp. TaxID=1954381 RepID=UPI003B8C829F